MTMKISDYSAAKTTVARVINSRLKLGLHSKILTLPLESHVVKSDKSILQSTIVDNSEPCRVDTPLVFLFGKSFRQEVSYLLFSWYVFDCNLLVSQYISDKMMSHIYVLAPGVKNWILCQTYGTEIITMNCQVR